MQGGDENEDEGPTVSLSIGSTVPTEGRSSGSTNSSGSRSRRTHWTFPPLNSDLPQLLLEDILTPSIQVVAPHFERAWIHRMVEGEWERTDVNVAIQSEPFSKGAMRFAHLCIESSTLGQVVWVVKRYRKEGIDPDQYFNDVEMHNIGNHYGQLFNSKNPPKSIRFLPSMVLELFGRPGSMLWAMEPYVAGPFLKHNNNDGFVNSTQYRCTPQAFSHFTLTASQGQQLVCDLQGVDDFYTDPQIVTADGKKFGRGNLGASGIATFCRTHVCNDVCRVIGLTPFAEAALTDAGTSKSDVTVPPSKSSFWPQLATVIRSVKSRMGKSSAPPLPTTPRLSPEALRWRLKIEMELCAAEGIFKVLPNAEVCMKHDERVRRTKKEERQLSADEVFRLVCEKL